MNPSSQLNTLTTAFGPAFVTATDFSSYFPKTFRFEIAGTTYQILSELFENPKELLSIERFIQIFARLDVEIETIGAVRTSQVVATFLGVQYCITYYNGENPPVSRSLTLQDEHGIFIASTISCVLSRRCDVVLEIFCELESVRINGERGVATMPYDSDNSRSIVLCVRNARSIYSAVYSPVYILFKLICG